MQNYKTEAVKELAASISQAGFRVFIAESGTHGFFTDAEGARVVSFQYELAGFRFSGNYKSPSRSGCGTGWRLDTDSFENMFNASAPQWATRGQLVTLTTLKQHLATYQSSSRYTEVIA